MVYIPKRHFIVIIIIIISIIVEGKQIITIFFAALTALEYSSAYEEISRGLPIEINVRSQQNVVYQLTQIVTDLF